MNRDIVDETFEEGRVALYQLERQLNDRQQGPDNRSEVSSKQYSATSDRRMLDQLPRNTRLNTRLESLGLTVEELDDRGLLEGGGAVPSYYMSMKQKNRKVLELQPRSHRLQERGKEILSKLLTGLFHMLRILSKRGLDLEQQFRSIDRDNRGLIHRKYMISTLKQLVLPFNSKELHDIANNYVHTSTDCVDYMSFLKDGRLLNVKKSLGHNQRHPNINETSEENNPEVLDRNISNTVSYSLNDHTKVLQMIKKGLLEVLRSLNKQIDDVYRMFTVWDPQGTGTVTATQFLRVLAKLHIDLSDQDQDFVIELLDTNGMGRIDFESLLVYCFETNNEISTANPAGGLIVPGTAIGFDDNAGETLSAVSLDGNTSVEIKSTSSAGVVLKRPHTASISRPVTLENEFIMNNGKSKLNGGGSMTLLPNGTSESAVNNLQNTLKKSNRPMTALARVSSGNHSAGPNVPKHYNKNHSVSMPEKLEDEVIDLPDDVINGEEMYLGPRANANRNNNGELYVNSQSNQVTQFTDNSNDANQYSENYDNPIEFVGNNPMDHLVLLATQILATLRDIILTRYRRGRGLREIFQHFDRESKGYFDAADFIVATADLKIETSDRVAQIAINQIGIDSKMFVTLGEFTVYVLDSDHSLLEANVTEQMAQLLELHGQEFLTSIITILYQEEDAFNDSKASANSKDSYNQHMTAFGNNDGNEYGFVSRNAFINSLKKIGLNLTSSELTRLVTRFDIQGNDFCSIDRFLKMIAASRAWKKSETVLKYQEQAVLEADWLRKQIEFKQQNPNFIAEYPNSIFEGQDADSSLPDELLNLPHELINMCEYLGIRVMSEQDMIWIASDALRAPLPLNWTAKKDHHGRTFFFNHLTNQSKWEHPLDPHFRNLRDKYRQSGSELEPIEEESSGFVRRVQHPISLQAPSLPSSIDVLQKLRENYTDKPEISISAKKLNGSPQLKYSNSFREQRKQQTSAVKGSDSPLKRPISAPITESKFSTDRNVFDQSKHHSAGKDKQVYTTTTPTGVASLDLLTLNNKLSEDSLQLLPGLNHQQFPTNAGYTGIPSFDPSTGVIQITNSLAGGSTTLPANYSMGHNNGMMNGSTASQNQFTSNYNLPAQNFAMKGSKSYFNYNSNNFSNSKTIVSAIYSSHYLKTPNIQNVPELPAPNYKTKQVVVGNTAANNSFVSSSGVNTGGVFVTTTGLPASGMKPAASLRPKSAITSLDTPPSVVDRALSLGKLAHLVQQPNIQSNVAKSSTRNTKLAEMLDTNIIEKLDNAIIRSNNHHV